MLQPLLLVALLSFTLPGPAAAESTEPLENIRGAVAGYLQRENASLSRKFVVEVGRLDPRLKLAHCGKPLEAALAPGGRALGNTSVGVRCAGPTPWTLYVPATVRQEFVFMFANQSIFRGKILTAEDVRAETRLLVEPPQGYLGSIDDVVGRVAVRQISPGTMLTGALLQSAKLVRRGQTVTLSLAAGPIAIQVGGVALKDGALGERIQVRNNSSRQVVEGVVQDVGMVIVDSTASAP